MAAAGIVAQVPALWTMRVTRAKCYDSRGPLAPRREVLGGYPEFVQGFVASAVDESADHLAFPGRRWDPPFSSDAQHGTFV